MKMPALEIMLRSLHLSSVLREYEPLSRRASGDSWTYEQYLQALIELETEERTRRRIKRLLKQSRLPECKTLATLKKERLPAKIRTMLPRLADGSFVANAENVIIFGLPGRGKTHLAAGIGREMIVNYGIKVLFTTAFTLVQQMLKAKAELAIEMLFSKLDRYELIILDDIGYVQQTREEMEILFTFLGERYERKSLMITSNLVFSEWDRIFKDPMTTTAAIDRLVHHSTILEMTGESYRAEQAGKKQK